jgi:hypothetical protein
MKSSSREQFIDMILGFQLVSSRAGKIKALMHADKTHSKFFPGLYNVSEDSYKGSITIYLPMILMAPCIMYN